jgi:uncharacterized membrane protein YczE
VRAIGLPEILVIAGVMVLFGLALLLAGGALRWLHSHSVQRALLDRIGSGTDLATFLQTPAGERLISSLVDTNSPQRAMLRSVRNGVVIIFVSVALLLLGAFAHGSFFAAIGIVLLFLGAGLLAAARVTDRMAKRTGEQ